MIHITKEGFRKAWVVELALSTHFNMHAEKPLNSGINKGKEHGTTITTSGRI